MKNQKETKKVKKMLKREIGVLLCVIIINYLLGLTNEKKGRKQEKKINYY